MTEEQKELEEVITIAGVDVTVSWRVGRYDDANKVVLEFPEGREDTKDTLIYAIENVLRQEMRIAVLPDSRGDKFALNSFAVPNSGDSLKRLSDEEFFSAVMNACDTLQKRFGREQDVQWIGGRCVSTVVKDGAVEMRVSSDEPKVLISGRGKEGREKLFGLLERLLKGESNGLSRGESIEITAEVIETANAGESGWSMTHVPSAELDDGLECMTAAVLKQKVDAALSRLQKMVDRSSRGGGRVDR